MGKSGGGGVEIDTSQFQASFDKALSELTSSMEKSQRQLKTGAADLYINTLPYSSTAEAATAELRAMLGMKPLSKTQGMSAKLQNALDVLQDESFTFNSDVLYDDSPFLGRSLAQVGFGNQIDTINDLISDMNRAEDLGDPAARLEAKTKISQSLASLGETLQTRRFQTDEPNRSISDLQGTGLNSFTYEIPEGYAVVGTLMSRDSAEKQGLKYTKATNWDPNMVEVDPYSASKSRGGMGGSTEMAGGMGGILSIFSGGSAGGISVGKPIIRYDMAGYNGQPFVVGYEDQRSIPKIRKDANLPEAKYDINTTNDINLRLRSGLEGEQAAKTISELNTDLMKYGQMFEQMSKEFTDNYETTVPSNDSYFGQMSERLEQLPEYKWNLEQGQKALERSAAAKGNLMSGNSLIAAEKFGQGLAGQVYSDHFNRVAGLLTGSMPATQQQVQEQANTNNLLAAGTQQGGTSKAGLLAQQGQGILQAKTQEAQLSAQLAAQSAAGWGQLFGAFIGKMG